MLEIPVGWGNMKIRETLTGIPLMICLGISSPGSSHHHHLAPSFLRSRAHRQDLAPGQLELRALPLIPQMFTKKWFEQKHLKHNKNTQSSFHNISQLSPLCSYHVYSMFNQSLITLIWRICATFIHWVLYLCTKDHYSTCCSHAKCRNSMQMKQCFVQNSLWSRSCILNWRMAIHPSATSSSLIISFNRALCIFKLQNEKKHHPNMQQLHSDPGGLISEFREGTAVISKIAQGLSRQGHLITKSIGNLGIEQNTTSTSLM